ncbi:MAG: hypothetical protein ACK6DB_12785 [Planctomycetota bacterium]
MRPTFLFTAIAVAFCLGLFAEPAWAQRGRGGGGGGGIRGGGGGGGMSRPAPSGNFSRPSTPAPSISNSQNRTPSMSRTAPSASPQTISRPQTAQQPAAQRPAAQRPSTQRPSTQRPDAASRPQANRSTMSGNSNRAGGVAPNSERSFQKPTSSQVNDFLKLPSGNSSSSSAANTPSSSRFNSAQTTSGDGSNTKSFTTEKGTTITVGGKSGSGTTAGGATVGGAVGGIKIETAGGDTIVKGTGVAGASKGDSAAIAAGSRTGIQTAEGGKAVAGSGIRAGTDGENSAVRGGQFAAGVDAQGNAAAAARGGYADSSGYRQGGAVTASRDSDGYTRINAAAGYSDNGIGQIKTGTAIIGPNGNVVSAGRGAAFVNGQFVGGTAWTAVNGNYTHWGYFGPAYPGTYPNCWWPGKWAVATTAWATVAYAVAGPYCGCSQSGTYYDYSENVTYENGNVYYEGEPVATAEQYYQEAEEIAAAGAETEDEEWLPLGVFSLIAEADQEKSDKVVQLALNKQGAIRGNFHDLVTDEVTPISGSVNKQTQRVALKLEGNDQLVVETGLYNLTNDECPVLIHFSPEEQEQRVLIRLKQPESEDSTSPSKE